MLVYVKIHPRGLFGGGGATDKTTKNFILGNSVQPNIRAQY
jgi:hypothetical protein